MCLTWHSGRTDSCHLRPDRVDLWITPIITIVVYQPKTAKTLKVTFFHFRFPTYPLTTMASGATMTWEDIHGTYIVWGHRPIYVVKSQVSQLMVRTRRNIRESQISVSPWYMFDQISVSIWYILDPNISESMIRTQTNLKWVHGAYITRSQCGTVTWYWCMMCLFDFLPALLYSCI